MGLRKPTPAATGNILNTNGTTNANGISIKMGTIASKTTVTMPINSSILIYYPGQSICDPCYSNSAIVKSCYSSPESAIIISGLTIKNNESYPLYYIACEAVDY